MQTGKAVTSGVVLRVTDTKETDRILTVLTRTGVLRVQNTRSSHGARRKNSRLAAACQMPAYSELTIFKRGSWYMLDEASPVELFDGLGRDIELLALAAWFCELTEAVCAEETPCPEILSLLLNALYALCYTEKEPQLVKAAFQWRLMALAGFEPLAEGLRRVRRTGCARTHAGHLRRVRHLRRMQKPGQPDAPSLNGGRAGGAAACAGRGRQAAVQLYAGRERFADAGSHGRGVYRRPAGAQLPDAGLLQVFPVGVKPEELHI